MNKFGWILLLGAFTVVGISPIALAQTSSEEAKDASEDMVDLKTVTCRDLLLSDGEEKIYMFLFLHGYTNGAKSDATIDGKAIAEAQDKTTSACIDSPDSTVFSVYEANL